MTKTNVPTVAELNKIVKEARKDEFSKIQSILSDRQKLIKKYETIKNEETRILKNIIKDIAYLESLVSQLKSLKLQIE